jgi:hypothetical protein
VIFSRRNSIRFGTIMVPNAAHNASFHRKDASPKTV